MVNCVKICLTSSLITDTSTHTLVQKTIEYGCPYSYALFHSVQLPVLYDLHELTAQHIHQMKPRLRDRTDRAWFSRFVWQPASKRSGSILTTPERTRDRTLSGLLGSIRLSLCMDWNHYQNIQRRCWLLPKTTDAKIFYRKLTNNYATRFKFRLNV